MASIIQNLESEALPDFRNLGVLARVLIGVNLAALTGAFYATNGWGEALDRFVQSAIFIEPLLIACLTILFIAAPWMMRLPYAAGCALVLAVVLGCAAGVHALEALPELAQGDRGNLSRTLMLCALTVGVLIGYFRLFVRAYSPALAEARLQALQARIRPHFLFNSLNAVLSLVRRDPRRAERALEDLADLFRTLMTDTRRFVRLSEELDLLERYASIEQLRLGERLRVTWQLEGAPRDALMPPLVLQPLLENAVYHGIEPGTGAGDIVVRIERAGDRVRASIENPCIEGQVQRAGNRMALENIRERLALFFDAEARIEARIAGGIYRVEIEMPYMAERS